MSVKVEQRESQTLSVPPKGLVPKLRFPGFDGGWKQELLSEIFSKKSQRNRAEKFTNVLTNSATRGVVNQLDYFEKDIAVQGNLQNYYIVDVDDFVYNPRISKSAPVGPLKRNKLMKGVMSPLYTVLKHKKGEMDFIEYYFDTKRWHRYMYKIANYGARHDRMSILQEDFFRMPVSLPSQSEQQKISLFLNAVDDWIINLRAQKEKLEAYKKGMMRKIFSQEIRFKDENGNDFPEWEEKRLGEVFTRVKDKNKINNQNVLTISAQQGLVNQEKYFKKSVSSKELFNYFLLKNGDFAYNKSYSKGYPMGAIKRLVKFDAGIVSPLYICFRLRDKTSLSAFFENYFNNGDLNKEIGKIAQEGARNHGLLNMGVGDFFNSVNVRVPTQAEQHKIVSLLEAVDDLLQSQHARLEQALRWKTGLMQQLFV